MSKVGFCQHDAGILKDDKLSDVAKKKFIDDVKAELIVGTAGMPPSPFPCGPQIQPMPFAKYLPLEDESKFPDFHIQVLGMYEKIAKALDAQSQFSILPICCPVSLALKIDADVPDLKFPDEFLIYGFALPLLAVKLGIDIPVDLSLKFPKILVPVPKIPPIDIPSLNFDPRIFPELFKFNAALYGLPPALIKVILELFVKMPQLAAGILAFDFGPFCDAVFSAKPFGDFDLNSSLTWLVAMKVLIKKTAECVLIHLIGVTLGSSSAGIVGGVGQFLGYQPPPKSHSTKKTTTRDKLIKGAKVAREFSLGDDLEKLKNTSPDKLRLTYTSFLLPIEVDDGKNGKATKALNKIKKMPTGILYARACLFRGGAIEDYYTKNADLNTLTTGLERLVNRRKAKIIINSTSFPNLTRGDIIICDDKSIVLTQNYTDGVQGTIKGIIGGINDENNQNAFTKISKIVDLTVNLENEKLVVKYNEQVFFISYAINVAKMIDDNI